MSLKIRPISDRRQKDLAGHRAVEFDRRFRQVTISGAGSIYPRGRRENDASDIVAILKRVLPFAIL
jgi:hypothetical protein